MSAAAEDSNTRPGWPKYKYLTKEDLENTPTRKQAGWPSEKEKYYRKTYCAFITELGQKLKMYTSPAAARAAPGMPWHGASRARAPASPPLKTSPFSHGNAARFQDAAVDCHGRDVLSPLFRAPVLGCGK
mmetsp:Transcript_29348/g.93955  ORF Transcript_29348/g.93955 Transcript_29348/m.93955 type:complete len:130 (-) Transcript_29348:1469-1858(-)